ncbi:conserved exported hypothetical protein [Magnetospirillum sp. LM-5]|uniref:DUF2066 domain-containing protein n=1 Tax=Magnetospirillum sp. LM-5 TaxID=2681466 RepID=UPI00138413E5|nr:DUF2066 domain-containing protein [Magnetospirillum sp. LM-5]CAA7614448.1 conserved exported hypothetical protein [Magnetospirillum sp. LM-5]
MPSLRLLCVLGLLLGLSGQVLAQGAADAFTVRGVEVDVSAANVQAAKDQAVAEGQRQAFRQLLDRLTQPSDHARLPKADGLDYVRDFTVDQERASATRYLASLTVRFNAAAVKKLLQNAGIPFADARARGVVIVPVYKPAAGSRPVLWDDPNPWRVAWVGLGGGGLVPLTVPAGEVGDVAAITPEQALAGSADAMRAIGSRWKSPDVLVAAAALSPTGKSLDVALLAEPGTPKPFDTLSYSLNDGESLDGLMRRAARDISKAIDQLHKQPNLLHFDRAGTVSALVPLSSLADWLAVRDRLAKVSQVRRWELVSLSKVEAAVTLHTVGEAEQVRSALNGAGLKMDMVDGFWTIRPVGVK